MNEESKSLNTYALNVLGCKVNQYDARQIARLLEGFGLREVDGEPADLVVVHTCGVTAMAVRKSRQILRRMIRENPDAVVFLTGCAASEEIIDGVSADARIAAGAGWIQMIADELQTFSVPNPDFHLPENADELAVETFGNQTRAFLKIQDGCDAGCAYCIVPQLRKTPRDKSVAAAVAEAGALVKSGYKEIVITGVHVGLYGRGTDSSLCELLAEILKVPNIGRIRMSSLHPSELTDELLAVWASSPNVMPHLHLSLQSGSDSVLERMGRGYTADEYAAAVDRARVALAHHDEINTESLVGQASLYSESLCFLSKQEDTRSRIREARPTIDKRYALSGTTHGNPAITTDVIVGFPGETDEEFEETFEFCKRIGFSQMHIFNFSPRPGTRAADMPNPVDPQVAQARHQRLADLAKEMSLEFNQRFVGQTVNVLVEGYKEGICSGGSEQYISISFHPPSPEASARQGGSPVLSFAEGEKQKRTVVSVKISTASADGLVGEVVK